MNELIGRYAAKISMQTIYSPDEVVPVLRRLQRECPNMRHAYNIGLKICGIASISNQDPVELTAKFIFEYKKSKIAQLI